MTLMLDHSLRTVERSSIRAFIIEHVEELKGHVLDLGCGVQPYRDIVEAAGGEYVGWDRAALPANVSVRDYGQDDPLRFQWDAILCTQVIQYVPNPRKWVSELRRSLKVGGSLVLTGPTNWPIVESADRWRFTPNGIASLLNDVGFFIEVVEKRAEVEHNGESWLLGWGAVARA